MEAKQKNLKLFLEKLNAFDVEINAKLDKINLILAPHEQVEASSNIIRKLDIITERIQAGAKKQIEEVTEDMEIGKETTVKETSSSGVDMQSYKQRVEQEIKILVTDPDWIKKEIVELSQIKQILYTYSETLAKINEDSTRLRMGFAQILKFADEYNKPFVSKDFKNSEIYSTSNPLRSFNDENYMANWSNIFDTVVNNDYIVDSKFVIWANDFIKFSVETYLTLLAVRYDLDLLVRSDYYLHNNKNPQLPTFQFPRLSSLNINYLQTMVKNPNPLSKTTAGVISLFFERFIELTKNTDKTNFLTFIKKTTM